jgi:hypothetical protein
MPWRQTSGQGLILVLVLSGLVFDGNFPVYPNLEGDLSWQIPLKIVWQKFGKPS